jgi:hypothetical protein
VRKGVKCAQLPVLQEESPACGTFVTVCDHFHPPGLSSSSRPLRSDRCAVPILYSRRCMNLCGANRRKYLKTPCSRNKAATVLGHLNIRSYRNTFLVVPFGSPLPRKIWTASGWFAPRLTAVEPLQDFFAIPPAAGPIDASVTETGCEFRGTFDRCRSGKF